MIGTGVSRQMRCLGYVPDDEMSGLNARAAASVPIRDVWALRRPEITSDIAAAKSRLRTPA
jgi:hypothetical protein